MSLIKQKLKNIKFVRKVYELLVRVRKSTVDSIFSLAAKNRIVMFMVMVFDRQLQLEYQSLIYANKLYRDGSSNKLNEYYLRRQLHRIEKGLIRKNGKKEFATDIILTSMNIFVNIANNTNRDFIKYGHKVFSEYFLYTGSKKQAYLEAKMQFEEFTSVKFPSPLIQEYKNKNVGTSLFTELVHTRKSIRSFKDTEVKNVIIEDAISLAMKAPTGCNRQPFRFIVVKSSKLVSKYSKLPPGGEGNSFGAPMLIFVIGDHSAYPSLSSSHEAYIDASLASMTLVYAFENSGVSTCFMNWPHIYKLNIKAFKELKIKKNEVIVTSIAIGYASEDATYAYSQRRNTKEVLEYL